MPCSSPWIRRLATAVALSALVMSAVPAAEAGTGSTRSYAFDEREGWVESDRGASDRRWWQDYEPVDRTPDEQEERRTSRSDPDPIAVESDRGASDRRWWQDYEPVDRTPDEQEERPTSRSYLDPIADRVWRYDEEEGWRPAEPGLDETASSDFGVIPWSDPFIEDNAEQLLERKGLVFEDDW